MKEFLIMSFLALGIGIILLIMAILFIVQKKGGRVIVYATLLLFPVFLIAFPNLFLSLHSMEILGNVLVAIPRAIYSTIILIFVIFVIVKENISPQIGNRNAGAPATYKKILSGMRLLQYSMVANIIYLAPIFLGIVYCVYTATQTPQQATGNSVFDILASVFVWVLILFLPAAQYYAMVVILIIYFVVLVILMLATSINGVVRITTVANSCSKYTGLLIVMMFIPVVNIIFMLLLCYFGNRELKTTGGI
jgi:hypothetical protein